MSTGLRNWELHRGDLRARRRRGPGGDLARPRRGQGGGQIRVTTESGKWRTAPAVISQRGIHRTYDVGGQPVRALRDLIWTSAPANTFRSWGRPVRASPPCSNRGLSRPAELRLVPFGRRGDRRSLGARAVEGAPPQIGFVFQFFHLVPRLTAAENVELPMVFAGADSLERGDRVRRARRGGPPPRAASAVPALGGEHHRVAIARAVVMDPSLLLADEPTGNLDSASGARSSS